jgi:hypothetical protein
MTKADFVQLLKSHDWFYERTEDPRVYAQGAKERRAIFNAKAQFGDDGQYLFEKYAKTANDPAPTSLVQASRERRFKDVIVRSTGKIGSLIDISPNGYAEVIVKGTYKAEFLPQQEIIILD